MKEELKEKIIEILQRQNPGLPLDEAEHEAMSILENIDIYEQAKFELKE